VVTFYIARFEAVLNVPLLAVHFRRLLTRLRTGH
jgi:hypothetical protein